MPDPCPRPEQLERMLTDGLDGPEAGAVERHVAGCGACQRALEVLTKEPGGTLSRPTTRVADGPHGAGATFLERLARRAPTWLGEGPAGAARGAAPPGRDGTGAVDGAGPTDPRRRSIPGYEVLDELGRGGMGVVYRARQLGANRLVALKMIRAVDGSRPEDLVRFAIEGETLARLRHPNIVQVYEVGAHDGRPFLALEYVDGGSLAEVVAGSPQPLRPAAALVETLARAVHAAHQCGIVHRDLKPSNILLDRRGEGAGSPGREGGLAGIGTPKVADFGLAKPVAGDSGLTRTGQILGTPSYMAPEQATGAANVGVPADVYALGAILYELLTGRPPFRAGSPWDTMMQVVHRPPGPPSRWRAGLPRDLETICLKCLEKSPAGRYPSADALADDLRRWLAGEPVRARPAGAVRRAWMWCRRRPAPAALAGALIAAVAAGIAGIAVQWRRAEANLAEASARLALAMDAIEGYYTGVSQDVLLKQPELADLRRSLLRQPLEFYRRLRADLEARGRGDPAARMQLARALRDLARLTAEVGTSRDAGAAYVELVDVGERLAREFPGAPEYRRIAVFGRIKLGELYAAEERFDEARGLLARALADAERLAREHPGSPGDLHDQAACLHFLGDIDCDTGRFDESERDYTRGLGIRERLVRQHPEDRDYLDNLGGTRSNLAILYARRGQLEKAGPIFAAALEDRRRLDERFPGVPDYRRKLASCLNNLGSYASDRGRLDEAQRYFERALTIQEELTRANPTVALYRSDLAISHYNLGTFHRNRGATAAAAAAFRRAAAIDERLVAEHPAVAQYQDSLCGDLVEIARIEEAAGRLDRAEAHWTRVGEIRGRLARDHPTNPMHRVLLAASHRHLADIRRRAGRVAEAASLSGEAVADLERLVREHPDLPRAAQELAEATEGRGLLELEAGRLDRAEADLRAALAIAERLARDEPDAVKYRLAAARCRLRLGDVARRGRRPAASLAWYGRAIEDLEAVLGAEPGEAEARAGLVRARAGRARALAAAGRHREALADIGRATSAADADSRTWLARELDDPTFDPLRSRPEFSSLRLDLAFPDDPFAR